MCFDVSAPLDRWFSQGSFDSAADCKEAQRLKIEEFMNGWEKRRETHPDLQKPEFNLKQLELAQCIDTSQPEGQPSTVEIPPDN